MDDLARKKRKNTKTQKSNNQLNGNKIIVLHKASSSKVMAPDITYRFKRKVRLNQVDFVHESCVHDQVSLALVSGNSYLPAVTEKASRRPHRKRNSSSLVPFVPQSCLTNSVTPVIDFPKASKQLTVVGVPSNSKRPKRKGYGKNLEIVTASCITSQLATSYLPQKNEQKCSPEQDKPSYDIIFDTRRKKKGKNNLIQFVPDSCITSSTTKVVSFSKKQGGQQFINPYPAAATLSPEIIIPEKAKRIKAKMGSFVPESCTTGIISKSYIKSEEKPTVKINYVYVDRPNSPDIIGPSSKKSKKKKNTVVPFVPNSCTVEPKQNVSQPLLRTDALSQEAPQTSSKQAETKFWLPMLVVILIIFAVIGFVLQK